MQQALFQSGAETLMSKGVKGYFKVKHLFQSGAITSKWGKMLFQRGAFISKWNSYFKVEHNTAVL